MAFILQEMEDRAYVARNAIGQIAPDNAGAAWLMEVRTRLSHPCWNDVQKYGKHLLGVPANTIRRTYKIERRRHHKLSVEGAVRQFKEGAN